MVLFLQILSIVVMATSFILIVWKVLVNSGVKVKSPFQNTALYEKYEPTFKDCAKIFLYVLLFRIFVYFAGVLAYLLFERTGNKVNI